MFNIISSILHLGNIEFDIDGQSKKDQVYSLKNCDLNSNIALENFCTVNSFFV